MVSTTSRSTNGGGGGGGCRKFVPVLGGDGTVKAPPGIIYDKPPGEMSWIQYKLADHAGDHVVLSPEGAVLVISPGMESPNPRPSPFVGRLYNRSYYWACASFGFLYTTTVSCRFELRLHLTTEYE